MPDRVPLMSYDLTLKAEVADMPGEENEGFPKEEASHLRHRGFQSHAREYLRQPLSLDKRLMENPPATFFWHVRGDELREFGVRNGDILVVDRSREPMHGTLAVCVIEQRFRVRRLRRWGEVLVPVPLRRSTHVDPLEAAEVWGVVRAIVRDLGNESRPGGRQ